VIAGLGAFLAISALLAVVPGPDTAIAVRNALVGGRRAGLFTIGGIALGLAVWTLATGAGVAALLRASEPAFVALKLAGAAYLVVLGARALWSAARGSAEARARRFARRELPPRLAFRQGALTNLGNPKIAVFFTSFLPQFTPTSHASFLALVLLGALFSLIGVGWLTLYVLALARVGEFLRRAGPRRILDGVTGAVLLGFGVRLASEHR